MVVNLRGDAFNLVFRRDLPSQVRRNSDMSKSCTTTFIRVKIPIYEKPSPLKKEIEAGDLQQKTMVLISTSILTKPKKHDGVNGWRFV